MAVILFAISPAAQARSARREAGYALSLESADDEGSSTKMGT